MEKSVGTLKVGMESEWWFDCGLVKLLGSIWVYENFCSPNVIPIQKSDTKSVFVILEDLSVHTYNRGNMDQLAMYLVVRLYDKDITKTMTGQLPLGQLPWGQLPRRTTTPIGQLPRGQLPPGQLPPRTITPVGQLPRGQLPLLVGQLPLRTTTPK